jgi:hypothetical protein
MKLFKIFTLLFTLCAASAPLAAQSFSIDNLLTLSTTQPKNIHSYLGKRGFDFTGTNTHEDVTIYSFMQKRKIKEPVTGPGQSIEMFRKNDSYTFILTTYNSAEYIEGCNWLKKNNFLYMPPEDSSIMASYFFQKRNFTVHTDAAINEEDTAYRFSVQRKEIPQRHEVQFAEDLLRFGSHEYLVSFFGEPAVKKDLYYFSENELKKCSILFPNTNQQAIFIWEDEENYRNLSYILISGITTGLNVVQYSGNVNQNKWISKTGLHSGMNLKEVMHLNETDFKFYGRNSEFAFLIDPENTGTIDFKKCGVMLGGIGAAGYEKMLNKEKISAKEAVENDLQLYIFYLMIQN